MVWKRLNLVQKFAILSLFCITLLALVLSLILSYYLTQNILDREIVTTAQVIRAQVKEHSLYHLFSHPELQKDPQGFQELIAPLKNAPDVVRVKLWDREGTILWADDPRLIGRRFLDNKGFQEALQGRVRVELKETTKPEQVYERAKFPRLVELYIPIVAEGGPEVVGVVEVYKDPALLFKSIREGQVMSWAVIFLGGLVLYLSLFSIVRGASQTQLALERALREYSEQLERKVEARTREVQRRAEEWERTFDSVPDLTSIHDRDWRIVRCNKALASKLGMTPDQLIGEKCYRVLHGREAPWPTCPLLRTLQTGKPQTAEIEDPHLNGTFVLTCSPLFERGELIGAVHVARDVTEERRLGKEAEERRRWEEVSRIKSEFIANMSHELRTPLNSIIGFSELLVDKLYGDLNEKQLRYVNNILVSGKHLLALINDILDLSKVEAGKIELRPEAFNLREALEACLATVAPTAAKKGITLNFEVGEGLSTLTADPARFKQILYNLLSNAVKFTPGGGQVTVSARPVQGESPGAGEQGSRGAEQPSPLPPISAAPLQFLEISVQDTGIGVKKEDLPKLFQPFTQLDASSAKRHEGTGLGLALTKRLVELHGGQIRAESEGEGRGSTFHVTLPLRTP